MKKMLVVVAHPDDEVLGCGGTIARLVSEGNQAYVLILGEGVTSRDNQRNVNKRNSEIQRLKQHSYNANKILGVKKIISYNFPDNRLDSVPLLDIVKVIEKIKNEIKPEVIFTHYERDLNIDHQIAYKAVLTATRPQRGEPTKEIYSFEIPSSTEWSYPLSFSPNLYFDISKTIAKKLRALKEYKTELRDSSHPRSLENIKLNAKIWGVKSGLKYCEVFKIIRILK